MIEAAQAVAEERRTEVVGPELHRHGAEDLAALVRDDLDRPREEGVCLEDRMGLLQAEDVRGGARGPAHHEGHRRGLRGEYLLHATKRNERVVAAHQRHEVRPSRGVFVEPSHGLGELQPKGEEREGKGEERRGGKRSQMEVM